MKFRIKAFGVHLFISCVVAAISSFVVYAIWHPFPLAKAVGVSHIFILMLAIDVILGPLLTLIVAKEGKKSLKMDLMVIAFVQVSALAYGLYSIAINRPVYMVYDTQRVDLVQAGDILKDSLIQANTPYNKLPWGAPKWVAVKKIDTDTERNRRLTLELEEGISPAMQPTLYESLDDQPELYRTAHPISELYQYNPKNLVDVVLKKYPDADGFYALMAYELDMTVLLDGKNKKIIAVVDLRPWR